MYILRIIVGIVIIIFFFSFSYMNSTPVNIAYYKWSFEGIPLYLLVIVTFMSGVLIAWLNEILERVRLHTKIWKQNKKIKEYEKKLDESKSKAAVVEDDTSSEELSMLTSEEGEEG